MSKVSERLVELILERNLTSKKTAELLQIKHANMNRFLRGDRTPNFDSFVKMLYFFNCSADYLLGLKDIPTDEPLHSVLPFQERLRTVMKECNISQNKMIKEMPLSSGTLYKWISGKSKPNADSLVRIAAFLECSVDYLIGRVR